MSSVHVIGAGSWGTAMALVLAANGHAVSLIARTSEHAHEMAATRANERFLSGVRLPPNVTTCTIEEAPPECDALLVVVPSRVYREVAVQCGYRWPAVPTLVSLTKGLDTDTLERMTQLLARAFPAATAERAVVLAGPSHAEEVAIGRPTAVVAASASREAAERTQALCMRSTFRVYTNCDVIGVEIAVAMKNVIALAAGMCDGLVLGDNAKGALLTRGLAEIVRLSVAAGGKRETSFGLAGLGDLIATCTSRHSRNRYVGEEIARGRALEDVLGHMTQVAEGVPTTRAARALAAQYGVQLPITEQVHAVLYEGRPPHEGMSALMNRDPRAEDA